MNYHRAFQWMLDHANGGFTIISQPLGDGYVAISGLPGLPEEAPQAMLIFRAEEQLEQNLFIAAMKNGTFNGTYVEEDEAE